MRWFKAAGGLLAIVLVLTSCIKVDGTIKIEDDGSGNVDFLTALNPDALTTIFGDFGLPEEELGDTDDICSEFASDFGDPTEVPAGGTVTPYNEDGFCGSRVQYALAASTDHSANITDLFDDTSRLYKEGDNWFFETDFDVDEITSEADGAPQGMMDALFGEASFRISVDLPGRAIDGQNNATEVGDDGKFTWDIDVLNPPARLFAQTEPGSGGGSGGGGGLNPLVIVAIVGVLAALGAAFFFMRKNSGADSAMPDATMPGVPTAGSDAMATPAAGAAAGVVDDRATMAAGSMPVSDGPPIAAAPPVAAGLPVMPASSEAKETIVMSSQDAIDAAKAANPVEAAADTAAAVTPATPQPVYDEALGAWVVDDPARGRLRHDPASDTWNPV